jgi:hypothetical protein
MSAAALFFIVHVGDISAPFASRMMKHAPLSSVVHDVPER